MAHNKPDIPAIKKTAVIALVVISSLFNTYSIYSQTKNLATFQLAKKHFKRGMKFFNDMQYLAAVEFFRKSVEVYGDYLTGREYLARSYKLAGFKDAALKEWENLREIYPENVSIINKIDGLRYRDALPEKRGIDTEYIPQNVYRSIDFNRFAFRHPVDMAVDDSKNLYVTSFKTGEVIKINANGAGTSTFQPSLNGRLYGIDHHRGRLAVADFAVDTVYILSTGGKKLMTIGETGSREGGFHGPEGLCYDESGDLFVVDSGNHRVQKFNRDGKFILQFGTKGEYEGNLLKPTDIACLQGKVFVTDTGNSRLAVFDQWGNFIENISHGGMVSPRGISRTGKTLLISDMKNGLLFYHTVTGATRWFRGGGEDRDRFSMLVSAVVDRDKYLYCLDYNFQTVYLYSPLEKRYTNLDVEIASVDINSYPIVAYYVHVRNRDGSPLYGLVADNFRITEDRAPISNLYVDYLKRMRKSASIVLCVDRSRETRGYHNEIPWVADFILKKIRKNDRVKVVNFNRDSWSSNFDWSRRRTVKRLREREYGNGKNVGSALYNSVSELLPQVNRRAVVLITDGSLDDDSFQNYTSRNIIEYARNHYVPIYGVSFRKADPELKRVCAESGGALYRAHQVDSLRSLYDKIKNAEEYRYVLVYTTYKAPAFRGWWSEVKIDVDYKGQKGYEWTGYFVPGE